ncbi:MAG: holliday junction DNA helicase RuvB [Parcubacteria group bacterium Athens1014_10]|nr:MAG: holliday junction DNA helicase RuvB [Parcubacteria group bacterium Athens1014_10]TSD05507.1 MAG: holliday junction DNA helicase RuvB [Parcubacteria group bacterium Athens0714_12]
MEKKVAFKQQKTEDEFLDRTLRPRVLSEYIGQEKIRKSLKIFMQAALERKESLEHVLLHGSPGLGKTTLSYIIAQEMGVKIKVTSGPAIERAGDLAAILTNLQEGDVLFIDEMHRLNKAVEEVLYPALEEYVLDLVIGKGPMAQSVRINLPRFTLIGATTRVSRISSPLRDRFGMVYCLNFYENEDIGKIIERSAKILDIQIEEEAIAELAKRARRTPRVANRLLKRVRDYAQVKKSEIINKKLIAETLNLLEIDEIGLDNLDKKVMEVMIKKFKGGPVGLSTIAAAISEEQDTVEEVSEPFLIQIGFLSRTPKGRVATESAYQHFNCQYPKKLQKSLL